MTPVAQLLAEWADWWGLSSGDFAQVVASFFGSVCAVGAAVAAWLAAHSTAKSVTEMKEARLQSVRPTILVSVPEKITVSWTPADSIRLRAGGSRPLARNEQEPSIEIHNVGEGPAIGIALDWFHNQHDTWSAADMAAIENVFEKSSIEVSAEGDGVVFRSRNFRGLYGVYPQRVSLFRSVGREVCSAGGKVDVKLNEILEGGIRAFAVGALLTERFERLHQKRFDRFVLRYASAAGERIERRFQFILGGSQVSSYSTDGGYEYSLPTKPWEQLDVEMLVNIVEVRPPSQWQLMWARLLGGEPSWPETATSHAASPTH